MNANNQPRGSSLQQSDTPLVRPQSAQDWDERRVTIEDLYCGQDLDLRKVMEIMRNQNFSATCVIIAYTIPGAY